MSAPKGKPQATHRPSRGEHDYEFAEFCNGKGVPTDVFYPDNASLSITAKKICKPCTVREECLSYALKYEETHGVWGGLSALERAQVQRQRRESERKKGA